MSTSGAVSSKRAAFFLFFSVTLLDLLLFIPFGNMLSAQEASATWQPSHNDTQAAPIAPGRWAGKLVLQSAQETQGGPQSQSAPSSFSFELVVRILAENRGILVDIPEQGMFSYPIDRYSIDAGRFSFVLDAMGADEGLTFSGNFSSSFVPQGGTQKGGIVGTVRGRTWNGSFYVQKEKAASPQGELYIDVPVDGGTLPATLTFPVRTRAVLDANAPAGFPLVILVAGAGKTDRDGNNVDVPGKTDSLKQMAAMLRARNVGSLRYDRRGTGEAYKLEAPGHMTSFSRHILDLAAVIRAAEALPRRGRLIVAGMNEGAWMAMAALNIVGGESPVDGLVVLDASGQSPMETLRQSIESLDPESREKALEAAQKLIDTGTLIDVPEDLANFFSPNRKDWLATWLAFDPVDTLKKVETPVLFVYGERDMQVSREEFSKLAAAKPQAGIRIVPDMNYVLKEVHNEDENYAAFTDPSFKLPALLADLLASYAKAQPAPQGLLPWSLQ